MDVLLMSPDGTALTAHDSAVDAADADRVARLKAEREWIHDVKNTKGGKDKETPFGSPAASRSSEESTLRPSADGRTALAAPAPA